MHKYIMNNIYFTEIIYELNKYVLWEQNYINFVKNCLDKYFIEPSVACFRSMTCILYLFNKYNFLKRND